MFLQSLLSASDIGIVTQPNGDNGSPAVVMTTREEFPIPPGESPVPDAPATPPLTSPLGDTVDAPPPAPADDTHVTSAVSEAAIEAEREKPAPFSSNGADAAPSKGKEEEPVTVTPPITALQAEPALESPIAQPEELSLFNGGSAPANQAHSAYRDVSPIAEPDVTEAAPPVTAETPVRTVKETPPQVVNETVAKDAPAPVVKEPIPPVVKETPAPVIKETLDPVVVKETTPVVAVEVPAPVEEEASQNVTQETEVKETGEKQTLESVVSKPPPPVAKETPQPVFKETPQPVVKEPAAPSEVAADVSKATPPPADERDDVPVPQAVPSESTVTGATRKTKTRHTRYILYSVFQKWANTRHTSSVSGNLCVYVLLLMSVLSVVPSNGLLSGLKG